MGIKNSESDVFCGTSKIAYYDEEASNDTNSGIKLFKIKLSKYYDIVDILLKTLTPIEAKRAARYRHINDRNRFVICRSLLKYLLAKETNLDILKIELEKYDNHKPYFPNNPLVHFNLSHAGNYAIIAIGNCELGVDIEFIDPSFDFTEILSNVFSETEIKLINSSNNKRYSFYQLWTRKEAIVKAIGKGIDDDIFKIPVTDGSHSISSTVIDGFKKINVFSFNLNDDYVGSLALTEDINNFNKIIFSPIPTPNKFKFLTQ